MSITDFHGETFVAYVDISGFKELMIHNNAIQALNIFYSSGYDVLLNQKVDPNIKIEGVFVSDCAVLYANSKSKSIIEKLDAILIIIKKINMRMLQENYMLTSSIAYGEFSYHNRIEFPGIEKNPIYGSAYVNAFLDNEKTLPKMQPGQCRILINDAVNDAIAGCENKPGEISLVKKIKGDNKHLRYYWNLETIDQVEAFENEYMNSYNTKYSGMLCALKRNI